MKGLANRDRSFLLGLMASLCQLILDEWLIVAGATPSSGVRDLALPSTADTSGLLDILEAHRSLLHRSNDILLGNLFAVAEGPR